MAAPDRDFGVAEYWAADQEDRAVLVWRFARGASEAKRITDVLTRRPDGASTDFVFPLNDPFARTFQNVWRHGIAPVRRPGLIFVA